MQQPQNYIVVEDEEDEQEGRGCSGCVFGVLALESEPVDPRL